MVFFFFLSHCLFNQLADFVLNPVARSFQNEEQRPLNIFTEVKEKSYNGNIDRNDRVGLKKVL